MAQTPNTFFARMRKCTLCKDLELGPKPIFQLRPNAKILIVGQAPGRITHHKGRPFDDPSGDRLRSWLGIDRDTFYDDTRVGIFPMALCFPGSGQTGDKPPPIECAQAWRTEAMEILKDVDLTVVLGKYAIAWHLPHLKRLPVTEAVRAASKGENNTFVLPHPSPRNNRWLKQNPWFETDVIPALRPRVANLLN